MASWEEFSRIVAEAKSSKKLDPVGQEDDDVDNDGDSDSSDSYLKKRRATVGAAIAADKKKKVEEALDPVGQEDKDIDNDGDHDKSDKYLLNRRKVRAKVIPPQERLKTDRDMFNIPKSEQDAARERILAKAKAKRMKEEVEQIDEIAPLAIGAGVAAAAAAPYLMKKFAKPAVDKAINKPATGSGGLIDKMKQRRDATNSAIQQLRQSFEPEGQMVEEDKEYRREMRKSAARERAEEKRERKGEGKKSAKAPGRLGKSAGTSYADKEHLSIKGHDEVTKKSGHTVGNPFPENYETTGEYIEEMPYQVYGSPDGKTEKKIGKLVKSKKYAHGRAEELADTHKETGGKYRVQKEDIEHIEEKALSRAQQRFMGMVYAAKKGETPASPEVAKAASGMSKKAAKDFAKTKHEGLPEKKEDAKEEFSLVDRILVEVSDAQLMAVKARREERAKKQQGRLHQAKVATKANKMMRDEVKEKETPKETPKENKEKTKKEKAKEEVKTRNTATERAARTSAAGRVKAARIAREAEKEKETARTERQRERIKYTEKTREVRAKQKELETKKKEEVSAAKEKQRQERSAVKEKEKSEKSAAKERQSTDKAKQKELEKKEKEKISQIKEKEQSRKKRRSELRSDIKAAWSGSTKVAGDKKDTEAVAAGVSNAASLAAGVAKTGLALGKYAYKKATEKRGEKGSEPSKSEKKEPVKSESKPETTSTERVSAKSDEKKTDTTPKKLSGTPERKKLPVSPERKKLVPSTKRLPAAGETGKPKRETGMSLGQRARRNPALKSSLIKSRMEEYSNWREEFIFEVDDQSIKEPQQKIIDVTKKKNKIEINPNMSEGCGCDEKEDAPKKDMRDLATKVNLAKTKARLMGSRNPMVMVVSKEETEIEEGMTLKDFKANRRKNKRREASADAKKRGHVGKEWYNSGRTYSPDEAKFGRAKMDDEERSTRKRSAIDPDAEDSDYSADKTKNPKKLRKQKAMGESAAWTKKEGKSEAGGLNEKGRKSYERENPGSDLKAPSKKVGNPRRASFCSRMKGMKAKLTSKKTANDPDSRINKSLRAWNC